MIAGHRKLTNLALIIDRNTLQQGARVAETNDVEPLGDKFRAFGWEVIDADGHDPSALIDALARPDGCAKPLCVIAHTTKGKGVSYMEDQVGWHHGVPTKVQLDQAMKELSLTRARKGPHRRVCSIAGTPSPAHWKLSPSRTNALSSSSTTASARRNFRASASAGRRGRSTSASPSRTWSGSAPVSPTAARFRSSARPPAF
jgi:hypothetical protein